MLRLREFILILTLALLWSFTFLIVRIGVHEMSPITLSQYRLIYAAIFLVILALITRNKIYAPRRYWGKIVVSSILLNAFPFTVCALGEVYIESSTTGIIEGSTPIFTILTGWLIFKHKRIRLAQTLAFVLGFIGLLVVFAPCILDDTVHNVEGIAYLFGMALSFALGFNFSAKYLNDLPPISVTTIQMILAPFILLPFTLLIDGVPQSLPTISLSFLLAILGVTSSLGWVTYFFIIKRTTPSNASIATMICPIITIIWGRLFLEELVTWNKVVGTLIVILSIFLLGKKGQHYVERLRLCIKKTF